MDDKTKDDPQKKTPGPEPSDSPSPPNDPAPTESKDTDPPATEDTSGSDPTPPTPPEDTDTPATEDTSGSDPTPAAPPEDTDDSAQSETDAPPVPDADATPAEDSESSPDATEPPTEDTSGSDSKPPAPPEDTDDSAQTETDAPPTRDTDATPAEDSKSSPQDVATTSSKAAKPADASGSDPAPAGPSEDTDTAASDIEAPAEDTDTTVAETTAEPDTADAAAPDAKTPAPSNDSVASAPDIESPADTDTTVAETTAEPDPAESPPEPADTAAPDAKPAAASEDTDTAAPQTAVEPDPTESRSETADTATPDAKSAALSEDTDTAVPETAAESPSEPADTAAPDAKSAAPTEDTDTAASDIESPTEDTDTTVPETAEAPAEDAETAESDAKSDAPSETGEAADEDAGPVVEAEAATEQAAESEVAVAETAEIPEAKAEPEGAAPAHRRLRKPSRRGRIVLLAAVVVVALLVGAWAVDSASSSDQVARNVEVAGEDVGGLDEEEVRQVVAEIGVAQAQRPVTIDTGDKEYETTAAALGLTVNEPATVDALLDAGSDGNPLLRPLSWLASFVRPRDVSLRYAVDDAQATANLEALQGADRTAPVEPTMPLGEGGFAMVPGQAGRGIDPATFPDLLLEAAEESTDGRIEVGAKVTTLEPAYTDEEVQLLSEQANNLTAAGLTVKAGPVEVPVPPAQLRTWIDLAPTDGGLDIAINDGAVNASLPALVGVVGDAPVNATVTLDPNGTPVVVPGRNGVTCCGEDSSTRIWDALSASQPRVELVVREAEPEWTTAEVQAWGITQPIGGSRAWRNGGEVPGPGPGFTTYHDCCAARVTNIHRLADMIRGAVIPPGGDFSVNDYAGPRTSAKGFVLAGAIAQGQHVDEIGGGVSQFATTTFNAAYFAGLDITTYQAHTEYFSRYPRGREATMGYPKPDLAIHNNTPYGLMIWTSYTDTSLTVTFYSTPWATAEQTGISESRHGGCRTVVTTRTRWFPDGTAADDTFKATYRPGEGQFC